MIKKIASTSEEHLTAQMPPAGTKTLLGLFYQDLRQVAQGRLRNEAHAVSVFPTELVHEAYMRLREGSCKVWQSRAHFFGAAARAMRQVLIDRARKRKSQKHGGAMTRNPLDQSLDAQDGSEPDWELVDEAFSRLESSDPRAAKVAELFFFGGLSVQETAKIMKISPSSVKREWSFAKSWIEAEVARLNSR